MNFPEGGDLANPSATVGLAAKNGSATTGMRSDGAPALDQSIAPTWTGQHIWTVGLQIPPGSIATPGIFFTGFTTTGYFIDTANANGIGIVLGGEQVGVTRLSASVVQYSLGANSTCNNTIASYNASAATGPTFSLRRGRGNKTTGAVPQNGDQIGRVSWQPLTGVGASGWESDTFSNSIQLQGILTETATADTTHVGSQVRLLIAPIGSGTLTEVARFDNESGFQMFGANKVIGQNRGVHRRMFTFGTLPSGPLDGVMYGITDSNVAMAGNYGAAAAGGGANHVPVEWDGGTSMWRIG